MRTSVIFIALLVSTIAAAIDASHWVEVTGGEWHPDSAALISFDAALRPAVSVASKNRGELRMWSGYTFQYQGRTSLLRGRYIFVNAFCEATRSDVHEKWVEVLDGGTCFFSAKYDPKTKRVYDVQVNGLA
jgi:hypothetical protein